MPRYRSMELCDGNLWKAFKEGSMEAFEAIYHRYFDIIMQQSLKLHHDKAVIEDCVHDLFVEIWNNRHNLSLPRSVKAYLLCSVHRKIIRKIRTDRNHIQFDGLHLKEGAVPCIEKQIIAEQLKCQQRKHIRKAFRFLTRRQQEALYLKFYDNLSYTEIAERMFISTAAIYNLVSKAIFQISSNLDKKALNN